jgi:AcrR family transcriptional regulator
METSNQTHLLPRRPPRQRAQQQRAKDKIDTVVGAAVEALEKRGEAGVHITDISRKTGVSYGAIYHHFGDRDGLIRAAQYSRMRLQPIVELDALRMALQATEDAERFNECIESLCQSIVSSEHRHDRLVRASALAAAIDRPQLRAALIDVESELAMQWEKVIVQAQEHGVTDTDLDPLSMAVFVEAVAFGVVLMELLETKPDPRQLGEVLRRGLTAVLTKSSPTHAEPSCPQ